MAFAAFIAPTMNLFPYWQGEAREAYEWVYADLKQIETRIEATADELVDEISREIARLHRRYRRVVIT
ncbi:hypothetical protein ACPVTF_16530 [Geobacillus icigianus]|uniref:Uncharacterized protein n=1 Tax=Geobacillus subterraneus TaxID=129338 RepID=A0A679FUZ5_9BACL|nr:hypothetical protein B4113_0049 [Geobacillus sp. B4113_201601]BBW97526.1 hypothetical protein GsuE55_23590 [Geobacillus subterraneus]